MRVRILRAARRDLKDGFKFYERQRPGAGQYFIESLLAEIDALAHNGGIHPVATGGLHRMVAHRFPYAVFYRVAEQRVDISAVIDCRRDPEWIHERLGT